MEITNNASQSVAIGANVLYSETIVPGGQSIIHRDGSGIVTLRGRCCGQPRARFRIVFTANIKADVVETITGATPLELAITVGGEPIEPAIMMATVASTTAIYNIGTAVYLDVPSGTSQTIAVKNIGTLITDVMNANLIVERVA